VEMIYRPECILNRPYYLESQECIGLMSSFTWNYTVDSDSPKWTATLKNVRKQIFQKEYTLGATNYLGGYHVDPLYQPNLSQLKDRGRLKDIQTFEKIGSILDIDLTVAQGIKHNETDESKNTKPTSTSSKNKSTQNNKAVDLTGDFLNLKGWLPPGAPKGIAPIYTSYSKNGWAIQKDKTSGQFYIEVQIDQNIVNSVKKANKPPGFFDKGYVSGKKAQPVTIDQLNETLFYFYTDLYDRNKTVAYYNSNKSAISDSKNQLLLSFVDPNIFSSSVSASISKIDMSDPYFKRRIYLKKGIEIDHSDMIVTGKGGI
jgi:hypothetical protein